MSELRPLRGVRYNVSQVSLGRVLAPPYDVIDPAMRSDLYDRDPHNVVRVDFGKDEEGDREGVADRHTRAAGQLAVWLRDGTLVRDESPALYVTDHEFPLPDGGKARRRGVFGRLRALPWDEAPIQPHERTLSGPKRDRLALMRASGMQTSAVFGLWSGAPDAAACLAGITAAAADAEASFPGESGDELVRLWVVTDPGALDAIGQALVGAELHIADGHHRYETAAAHAAERRFANPSAPPGADFEYCLVYLCAADDPGLLLWPTHRLVRPRPGVPISIAELGLSVDGRFEVMPTTSLQAAATQAASRPEGEHALAVVTADGSALLTRRRATGATARERLDVAILEQELLRHWGLAEADLCAGALHYERSPAAVAAAVKRGEASIGILLRECRVEDMLAVAAAGDTMPQKSTYFYPKVPTGLIMSPLGGAVTEIPSSAVGNISP